MPKFKVCGYRDMRMLFWCTVEAEDEMEAEEKALSDEWESGEETEGDVVEEQIESIKPVD